MSAFAAINFATTSTWSFPDALWSGDSPFWEEVKAYEFIAIWIQISHKGPLQLQCRYMDIKKTRRKNLVRLLEEYFAVLIRLVACARILRRDKHLPGVVTETCGACCLFTPLSNSIHTPIENEGGYSWEWKQRHVMGPLLYGIEGWKARKDDDGLVDECQKQWVADTTPCHSQSTLTILVSCNSFYVTFLLWI